MGVSIGGRQIAPRTMISTIQSECSRTLAPRVWAAYIKTSQPYICPLDSGFAQQAQDASHKG